MNMKNKSYNEDSAEEDTLNRVIIKDGELIRGVLITKLGLGSKGLIRTVFNDWTWHVQFLKMISRMVTRYIILTGFSVGISDLIADRDTNEKIKNTVEKEGCC